MFVPINFVDFLRNFERLHPTFPLSIIDDLAFSSLEKEKSIDTSESDDGFTQIYFVGKLLWSGKGFDRLLQCQERFRALTGNYFSIDVYGGGPEEELIKSKFRRESGNNNVASCSCDKLPETSVNEASELYLAMVDSVFSSSTSLRALAIENNHPQLCPTSEVGKDILQGEKLESKKSSPLFMELAGGAIHTAAKTCHAVYNLTCSAVDGVFEKPKNAFSVKECSDPIPAQFMGVKDHSLLRKYKIFVNPSVTEVLCTTTAEALAMEKWVIIPAHPSNIFFYQFPNCLTYETLDGFVRCLKHALEHDTKALSGDLAHVLSWEAATERLIRAAAIHTDKISESKGGNDSRLRWLHTESGKVLDQKFIRDFIGGSRDTLDEYLDEQ